MNTKPSLELAKYVGTYTSELYGDVKITMDGDRLKMAFGPAFVTPLEHWNYDTFRGRFFAAGVSKPSVTFAINAQGKADSLILGMPGMAAYPFKKAPDAK